MRDYKYLEELNLEEVAKNTQIEINCLKFILQKDFSKLKKFNLKGFSKILAREYGIDLSSFILEYQEYLDEFEPKEEKSIQLTPRMESYAPKPSKFWLWVIGFAAVVALASYLNVFSFLYDLKEEFTTSSNSTALTKAKENVKELEKSSKKVEPLIEASIDLNSSKEAFLKTEEKLKNSKEEVSDTNYTDLLKPAVKDAPIQKPAKEEKVLKPLEEEKPLKKEEKSSEVKPAINTTLEDLALKSDETKDLNAKENVAKFIVAEKFWLGTIILKNYAKRSRVVDKDFEVKLDGPTLLTTGHAPFKVEINGVTTEYKGGFTKYFLYENGELKRIKRKEFISKNRGRAW